MWPLEDSPDPVGPLARGSIISHLELQGLNEVVYAKLFTQYVTSGICCTHEELVSRYNYIISIITITASKRLKATGALGVGQWGAQGECLQAGTKSTSARKVGAEKQAAQGDPSSVSAPLPSQIRPPRWGWMPPIEPWGPSSGTVW